MIKINGEFGKIKLDHLAWLVTTILFTSFFMLMKENYGRYIYTGLSLILILLSVIKNEKKLYFRLSSFAKMSFIYICFLICSVTWAWNPSYAWITARTTIMSCFYAYSVYMYYKDEDDIHSLFDAIVIAAVIVSIHTIRLFGFSQLIYRTMNGYRLINDVFINVNVISMLCAFALLVLFYRFMMKKNFLWIIPAVPLIIVWAAAGSRKGMVIILLGVLLYFVNLSKDAEKIISNMIFIMAVFIFILIICVNIPFFSGYFERFIEFIESMLGFRQKDASAVIRGGMIDIGFEQFLKTPVLGIGGGNSVLVSAKQNGIEVYLHNNYIDQLVNIGMAGTCVYYFYYIIPFRRLYQNRTDTTSRLCFSFLLVTLILDYGMVSSTSRETFFYLMIFHLQNEILRRKDRKKEVQNNCLYGKDIKYAE